MMLSFYRINKSAALLNNPSASPTASHHPRIRYAAPAQGRLVKIGRSTADHPPLLGGLIKLYGI